MAAQVLAFINTTLVVSGEMGTPWLLCVRVCVCVCVFPAGGGGGGVRFFQQLAACMESSSCKARQHFDCILLCPCLATHPATAGHYTLVVSTDPAHSLRDSLAQEGEASKKGHKSMLACIRFQTEVSFGWASRECTFSRSNFAWKAWSLHKSLSCLHRCCALPKSSPGPPRWGGGGIRCFSGIELGIWELEGCMAS